MTSATNDELRTLVSDYYHGLVTFQSYRQQRDSILDGLGKRSARATENVSRDPPTQRATVVHAKPVAASPQQNAPVPADARSWRRWAAPGGVAIALAVAAATWVVLQKAPETQSAAGRSESPTLGPGAALLEQFMQRNAWDRDAVRNLEVTWGNALTDEQRQSALTSPSYGRFRDTLRGRLREEEALSGPEGSPELEVLAGLAGQFGVPYSRTAPRAAAAIVATPPSVARTDGSGGSSSSVVPGETGSAGDESELVGAEAISSGAAPVTPPSENAAASDEPAAETAAVAPAAPTSSTAAASTTAACSAELLSTRRPFCSDALRSGGSGPNLAIVPAGSFEMGSEQTNDERPPHAVTIGRAFAMSVYEVSFAEFGAYCRATGERCPENPWSSDDFPVALVSWDEAVAYARWLSSETAQTYRLPSEAEWEYAARAGSSTRYPFGDDVTPVAARSSANGPVDSPLANSDRSVNRNAFRLFHMIGNMREWVADHWSSGYAGAPTDGTARQDAEANARIARGGSYSDGALNLRSAARGSLERDTRDRFTGFRVVRELPP